MNRKFSIFMKVCLSFLGIVFFPIGIPVFCFMLGKYSEKGKAKKSVKQTEKTEGKITDLPNEKEIQADRVVIY